MQPKSAVSPASSAAMAIGTILQAVHTGALIPATACAAMLVRRDCPPGSRLQNNSGAWAETLTWTNCAALQSVPPPVPAAASAAVAKQAGGLTVLVKLVESTPSCNPPKLSL